VDRPCRRRRRRHSPDADRASVRARDLVTPLRHRDDRLHAAGADAPSRPAAGAGRDSLPAALLAAAINIAGFLGFYALYGNPAGALRTIAIADLVALPPLAFAAWTTLARG